MNNEEKKTIKEQKSIEKFIKNKDKYSKTKNYINVKTLNKKYKNAQTFMNTENINDDGIIKLKDNTLARIFSVDAIDLSLSSNNQKLNFFNQLKYLYQIKDLDLRIYKLDDKLDLNKNKDYYKKLLERFINDKSKVNFLQERYYRLEKLEEEK